MRQTFGGILLFGLALSVLFEGACAEDRGGFERPGGSFDVDASADAADGPFQCSLDGRSVVRAATGEIVTTCPSGSTCGAAVCQAPCAAAAAERSSNGCEFYLQTPRFTKDWTQSCYAAYVVNTSIAPVIVSLELEGRSLDLSKSMYRIQPDASLTPQVEPIAPGESAVVFISDRAEGGPLGNVDPRADAACPKGVVPAAYADPIPDGTGIGSSFHLTTNVPVSLAAIYPFGGAPSFLPSATLLLPVATWAKQHIIVDGWEASITGVPGTQIVASEDDTEVTVLPKRDIQDGPGVQGSPAGTPSSYRLGKGQVLQLVQLEELSGSIVESSKPTSVFGGHSCAYIPVNRPWCDILAQQIPAFEQWGSEYVAIGYRPRLGVEQEPIPYRIVAARDDTHLDYDPAVPPGAPITLSAGEVATFISGEAFVVRTQDIEHPIYLAAYMTGGQGIDYYRLQGDPEFVNVVPAGQYMNSYSFYADPTYSETSLVIVRARTGGQFRDVSLECAGNLSGFRPVGARGDYEYVRVDLARDGGPGEAFGTSVCRNGVQRMRSDGPFTATLWGWDMSASYAYPGGMAQRKLVKTPLPPIIR